MNITLCRSLLLVCALLIWNGSVANAIIVGINTPGSSNASIIFDDTTSLNSSSLPGITNTGPAVSPWNGTTQFLPLTTDSVTGDFAKGKLSGTYTPLTNNYAVNLFGARLQQTSTGSGFATLTYRFNIEYQLDGSGMPPQATIFPTFLVNGTVLPAPGSFASVVGFIDYFGTHQTTAGLVTGLVEKVNYNNLWNTPGIFTAPVTGVPVNGFTPPLIPFTTLTLNGMIQITVDPASIEINPEPIPEPSSFIFGGLGVLGTLIVALRRCRTA